MNEWAINNLVIPVRRLWKNPGWRFSVLAFGIGVVVKLALPTPAPVSTSPYQGTYTAPQGGQSAGAGGSVSRPAPSFAAPHANPYRQRQRAPYQGRPGHCLRLNHPQFPR